MGNAGVGADGSPLTATAIDRLESAGAIVVGKTNVPVMLADWQTYNPLHGTTNNPWSLSLTPGGSKGGGAAALAAGIGALTMGTDLSGSIRIPAHFCGVYGHKPSLNLISMEGVQPGPWNGLPGPPMDIAVAGPMARGARDLALALDVAAGPNSVFLLPASFTAAFPHDHSEPIHLRAVKTPEGNRPYLQDHAYWIFVRRRRIRSAAGVCQMTL